ncbi:hypothetical protein PoB_006175600 [Plakobranchus ocellatus]|uniref:SMB domain-containing protein n=1 Tax=Plakobranchus ocellatus TaxID=259542 RepID=A0AAV4CU66_9GAST|nr:hypothetical protein PoB_006175600 [Plakobranchus ocellatus]
MAGVMMLLTTPILLCSTPEPSLNSKDRTGTTFVTSATSPFQTDSENITIARRNTYLIDGQPLSNCHEDLKTFNSTQNSSYPDQWPEKVVTSLCAYNDSINSVTYSSQVKIPKNTSEELDNGPKDERAIALSTEPWFHLIKNRLPDMFHEQNAPPTLQESTKNINAAGNLESYTLIPKPKQKNSLAESTLGFVQVTSPTILDDGQDLDLSLTFTCQGRCGKKISFPCSCSATCVIYGTCCDNMAQDCPHVLEEGLTRFDLIRTSDFICDQNSIYTIVSCPVVERNEMKPETSNKQMSREETESLKIQNQLLSNLDTTEQRQNVVGDNSTSAIEPEKTRTDSITNRLLAALSAAPVTDSDTGLTFINKTVYNCNKMSESKALYWAVLLNYSYTSPTKLEDFVQHQILNKYRPTFNKVILTDHICIRNLKKTCNQTDDIGEYSRIFVEKCLESSNAVVLSYTPPSFYYRNQFCAFCNDGRYSKYRLHLSNNVQLTSSPFQVLMTLTEDTFSLKKVNHGFEIFRIPWSQAKCPIHAEGTVEQVIKAEKSDQDSDIQCSVSCDDPNFTLRSDGMCKAPHGALVAIADDGLTALCPEAVEGLAQFLACGLKQEIENLKNADFSAPSVSVVFDSNLNRSLYVVRLHFALPHPGRMFFSHDESDITENFYLVTLLVKSFHHYRISQKVCPLREEGKKNTELKVITSLSLIEFWLSRNVKIRKVMEEFRGPIVDDQNKTTVCVTQTVYCHKECRNIPNRNDLLCMDDPLHERDSAWIRQFDNSSCFYHFNELKKKAKNKAITLEKDSESFLQCVLSLSFLAVTILNSI